MHLCTETLSECIHHYYGWYSWYCMSCTLHLHPFVVQLVILNQFSKLVCLFLPSLFQKCCSLTQRLEKTSVKLLSTGLWSAPVLVLPCFIMLESSKPWAVEGLDFNCCISHLNFSCLSVVWFSTEWDILLMFFWMKLVKPQNRSHWFQSATCQREMGRSAEMWLLHCFV